MDNEPNMTSGFDGTPGETTSAPIVLTDAGSTRELRDASPVQPAVPDEETRRTARGRFSRMGVGTVMVLLVSTAVQLILVSIVDAVWPGTLRNTSWGLWVATFAPLYLAGIPAGLLFLRKIPAMKAEGEKMSAGRYFAVICISIFMMYAGNFLGLFVESLVESLVGFVPGNPLDNYVGGDSLLLKILCMVILAPVIEEYLFRRILIDRMRPYGERLAVVTTALMFGLFHGNLSQMFYAFTLGLVFGYVYLRTGKLRYTIGLHMLINLIGAIVGPALGEWAESSVEDLAKFDLSDMAEWARVSDLSEMINPAVILLGLYSVLIIAAAVAGLVLLIVRRKKVFFRPAPQELARGQRFRTSWLSPGMLLFTAVCLLMIASTFLT